MNLTKIVHSLSFRMASTDPDVPTEMQDKGRWYGDAADYWKVRITQFSYRIFLKFDKFWLYLGESTCKTHS